MGLKIDLNRSPYFDDYDSQKDFYKMLWKPGLPVQVRELNQVQTYIQAQIERFADNIFKKGTIVAGVNFNFYKPYPYVKLADLQADGIQIVNPEEYVGSIVEDEVTGLKAYVVNYVDGFEASDPDLKTIYVKYINSGFNGNTRAFSPGNTITISEGDKTVWRVGINAGGLGFSNSDTVVFTSALLVNVASGAYTNSDYIIDPNTGANAEIVEADVDTIPGKTILKIKPKNSDLTNSSVNSVSWSFDIYQTVTNQSNTVSGIIEKIYGSGAQATLRTDAVGNIREVPMSQRGTAYEIPPYVTVKTSNSSASVGSINLESQNYIAKIVIPGAGDSVGNGYAFGVNEGIIYDLGYMVRVSPQVVIVEKYSDQPNNKVVGFLTTEEIINHNLDESLLDNALGSNNYTAPGADRLKLTPTLTITSKDIAAANQDFFTLVEWNDGNPVKQNQTTQYSRIGDQMAQTVYDQNGNFVLDAFQVTTASTLNQNLESNYYSVIVDPGQAYINGRKVQTLANYRIDLTKGTDTKTTNNSISLNYGNYIRVNELGGSFDASAGSNVYFYNVPRLFISNSSAYGVGNVSPLGTQIGQARIRSIEIENGTPGLPATSYRMYLFDIKLNAGRNFDDIRSVHMNETYDAIADVMTEYSTTSSANVAVLKEKNFNSLIFPAGVESLKNSNTSTYQYRTTGTVNTTIATGISSISISSGTEFFPYGINQNLSQSNLKDFLVVPVEDDLIASANITGTVAVNTSSTTVTGTSTNFFSNFVAGDYVFLTDGSLDCIRRIESVTGTTVLKLDSVPNFANGAAGIRRAFPMNTVIPFGYREGLSANVDVSGQTVTLKFGHSNGSAMAFTYGSAQLETKVTYNVERRNVQSALKTSIRNKYVKIKVSNNAGKSLGPWCIGVPDAFRLRAVYKGTSTVNTNSSDVTKDFYIDHNQNSNYLGLGYLYLQPQATYRPANTDFLLVCFDYFTRDDAGYYDTRSYLRTADANTIFEQDSKTFTALSNSSAASSWEVPQVYTYDNKYYDLLNQFDFRPAVTATATPGDNASSAPVNPTETIAFSSMSKFPKPNGSMTTQVEQYLGRIDDIYIGESGNIYALKGIPDVNPRRRLVSNHPKDSLKLQMLNIPPYPNMTASVKPTVSMVMNTKAYNEKTPGIRLNARKIEPIISTTNLQTSQPMVYTMEDIANLERRIKDLEYYQALSLAETSITNKVIPSSTDSSINRFKFGFFADDFSTTIYSDVSNPQYAAAVESEGDLTWGISGNPLEDQTADADKASPISTTIFQPSKIIQKETNRITPLKYIWSMKHLTENMFFTDELILEQNNASVPIVNDPCAIQISNLASLTPGFAYYTSVNKSVSYVYTENLAGVTTVYFNVYGANTDIGTKIEVLNSNGTIVASTSNTRNDMSVLSTTDKTFLSTNAVANNFKSAISVITNYTDYTRNANPSLTNYVKGSGKLTFNNGSGGKFTIVAESLDYTSNFKFLVKYPSVFSIDTNVVNKPNCDPAAVPVYRGLLQAGSLTLAQWSCSNQFRVNSTNYRAFVLEATGLKPNTIHKFYMDSVEWPHVINMTRDMILSARYDSSWKNQSAVTIGSDTLVASSKRKINEITRYLANARTALYDANGAPTTATQIKTNAQGVAKMMVFFPLDLAGWFSQDFNATGYGENQVGTDSNPYSVNYSSGKIKPTQGSSGYTALELTNGIDSAAIRVFANRTPNKVIPYDPKGTI